MFLSTQSPYTGDDCRQIICSKLQFYTKHSGRTELAMITGGGGNDTLLSIRVTPVNHKHQLAHVCKGGQLASPPQCLMMLLEQPFLPHMLQEKS